MVAGTWMGAILAPLQKENTEKVIALSPREERGEQEKSREK